MNRGSPRLPILNDVAKQAKVSLTTASRALDPTSDHSVSARTRARVQAAAASLLYRPNPMARALRTRRVPTIAIVVHDVTDPYFAEIVHGATLAASARGFLTVVCSSDRDPTTELRYVEMLSLSRVSGVIFAGGGLDLASYRSAMAGHAKSIAAYGGAIVALAPRSERWPAELPDNRAGARMVTEHLLSLGHVRIALISGPPALRTSHEREVGYVEAMKAARARPWTVAADFTTGGGARAAAQLMDDDLPPTAIFAATDTMALGVLSELQRRGIRVPAGVSVAGFDDIPGLGFIEPKLTTVRVPMAELGAAAVARLLHLLDGEPEETLVHLHSVQLVVRESTGRPRRKH
ncbi:MAG TPA: LacI family DNA-binding transcriptional regulator [Candidatus Dormibacteraeota bacterium]|nr:LacI family DNA-binding transcriptional regulator [Candidatus Dormibacteraeota bacterium]